MALYTLYTYNGVTHVHVRSTYIRVFNIVAVAYVSSLIPSLSLFKCLEQIVMRNLFLRQSAKVINEYARMESLGTRLPTIHIVYIPTIHIVYIPTIHISVYPNHSH